MEIGDTLVLSKYLKGIWRQHFCGLAGGQQLKIYESPHPQADGYWQLNSTLASLEMEVERRKQGEREMVGVTFQDKKMCS